MAAYLTKSAEFLGSIFSRFSQKSSSKSDMSAKRKTGLGERVLRQNDFYDISMECTRPVVRKIWSYYT